MIRYNDAGHGHVWPRSDGMRARCGGPALCSQCAKEMAAKQIEEAKQAKESKP